MSKLNQNEKISRKEFKADLKSMGGAVFSFPEHGVTVAIAPACQGVEDSEFVKVSVSYCSEHDEFKRKRGEFEALSKFMWGDGAFSLRRSPGADLEMMAGNVALWFEQPY